MRCGVPPITVKGELSSFAWATPSHNLWTTHPDASFPGEELGMSSIVWVPFTLCPRSFFSYFVSGPSVFFIGRTQASDFLSFRSEFLCGFSFDGQ